MPTECQTLSLQSIWGHKKLIFTSPKQILKSLSEIQAPPISFVGPRNPSGQMPQTLAEERITLQVEKIKKEVRS